ncbi:hypothetical protein MUK42_16454 [Musa troglodytarum]|uniref:Uncharacterized protein n=1 Tax=Musa troglodytarum TaxID=320322 RepID=A0A9E7L3J7_9LILI|nr:hypothetical protein MUK42_16454 [Musa troglodytarum]
MVSLIVIGGFAMTFGRHPRSMFAEVGPEEIYIVDRDNEDIGVIDAATGETVHDNEKQSILRRLLPAPNAHGFEYFLDSETPSVAATAPSAVEAPELGGHGGGEAGLLEDGLDVDVVLEGHLDAGDEMKKWTPGPTFSDSRISSRGCTVNAISGER